MNGLSFDFSLSQNLQEALGREWATNNSLGCSASMSILGIPTRRSHGLLISANGQDKNFVWVKNIDEQILIDDSAYSISTHLYSGVVHPEGYLNLDKVILSPLLTWIYQIEDLVISKTLILAPEHRMFFLRYQILSGDPENVRLELRPMLPSSNCRKAELVPSKEGNGAGKIETRWDNQEPSMFFYHNAAIVDRQPFLYRKIFYPADQKAGFDIVEENLFSPFRLGYAFMRSNIIYLAVSIGESASFDPVLLMQTEESRARKTCAA